MQHYSSKFKKPGEKTQDSNLRQSSVTSIVEGRNLFSILKRYRLILVFIVICILGIIFLNFLSSQNSLSRINLTNPFSTQIPLPTNDSYRLALVQISNSDDYKVTTKLAVVNISPQDKTIRILDFPVSEEENQDSRLSRLRYIYEESTNDDFRNDLTFKLQIPIDRIILLDEKNTFKFDKTQDFFKNYITNNANVTRIFNNSTSTNIETLQTDMSESELYNLQEILQNYPKFTQKTLSNFDTNTQILNFMSDSEVLAEQAKVEIGNSSDITGLGQKYASVLASSGILISKVSNFDKVSEKNIIYVLDKAKYKKTLQIIQNILQDSEVREVDPSKFSTADILVILK